jgi:hypothetical protein
MGGLGASVAAGSAASQFTTAVAVKRLRKTITGDVEFLKNRVLKLKAEEERSRAEIAKLRGKTDCVSAVRQQHDEAQSQRRALQDQVDYARRKEAALIALGKEQRAKAVWASKQRIVQEKRDAVLTLKKQREIDEVQVQIAREEARERKSKVRSAIQELHNAARRTRERVEAERREHARAEYESRIEEQRQECAEGERLAAELVAQEAEMLLRLRKLHEEKQRAIVKLTHAVTAASPTPNSSMASRRGATPSAGRPSSVSLPQIR